MQAFAGDVVLYYPTADGLRSSMSEIETLLDEHELVMDCAKTEATIFKKSSRRSTVVRLISLLFLKKLGCILDSHLSENHEIA